MVYSILRRLSQIKYLGSGLDCCVRRSLLSQAKYINTQVNTKDQLETKQLTSPLDHEDYFDVKSLFTLKELFDARVHLGHYEGCYDPLARPYIYGTRAGMHIIDLNQTVWCLTRALNVLSHIVYQKGVICFISTNSRYDFLIQKTARSCGEYFITRKFTSGTFLNSEHVLETDRLPDLLVCFQTSRFERVRVAIKEAAMCNIPTIGIVDTDCNPQLITYPIPGNDDTPVSVTKFCSIFQKAVLNAKNKRLVDEGGHAKTEKQDSKDESIMEIPERQYTEELCDNLEVLGDAKTEKQDSKDESTMEIPESEYTEELCEDLDVLGDDITEKQDSKDESTMEIPENEYTEELCENLDVLGDDITEKQVSKDESTMEIPESEFKEEEDGEIL